MFIPACLILPSGSGDFLKSLNFWYSSRDIFHPKVNALGQSLFNIHSPHKGFFAVHICLPCCIRSSEKTSKLLLGLRPMRPFSILSGSVFVVSPSLAETLFT